jgi:hypothetical protein
MIPQTESQIQIEAIRQLERLFVMRWKHHLVTYPNGHTVAPIYAVPNEGRRSPRTGKRMKDQGLRKGIPDLYLPIKAGGHGGLYVEVKTDKGRVSPEQKTWIEWLSEHGYKAVVCRSVDDILAAVIEYMDAP